MKLVPARRSFGNSAVTDPATTGNIGDYVETALEMNGVIVSEVFEQGGRFIRLVEIRLKRRVVVVDAALASEPTAPCTDGMSPPFANRRVVVAVPWLSGARRRPSVRRLSPGPLGEGKIFVHLRVAEPPNSVPETRRVTGQ